MAFQRYKDLLQQKKKEFYLLCRYNNNPILKTFYKNYCKILSKVISVAKHMYYNEVIRNSENKIKSTWKIINEEKGKTRSRPIIQFLKTNNNIVNNQKVLTNILITIFCLLRNYLTRITREMTKIRIHYITNRNLFNPNNKMERKYATSYELEKIINSLKSKNSHGYEEISNKIIKLSASFIISPLTYI